MSLNAAVVVEVGGFRLDVELSASSGMTLAVLGPNGAGKSTLFRALAGLTPIDAGCIELDGTVLDEPGTGVFVAPQDRPVGVVFQDHLLFPSMSVLDNVAFGLRCQKVPGAEARRRAGELLDRVGLGARGDDRPAELSGGQRQRVALARALAIEPRLLLLDEPLAALDVTTRTEIRRELRRRLDEIGGTRILVTHDPLDAFALADRIAIIEDGRFTQTGTLAEVTRRPRTPYVADLLGINLYDGRADGTTVTLRDGHRVVAGDPCSGPVFVVIHPQAVSLYRTRPQGSPRNVWRGTVEQVDLERDRARLRIGGPTVIVAEVTTAATVELGVGPGDEIWVSLKATEIQTYPR